MQICRRRLSLGRFSVSYFAGAIQKFCRRVQRTTVEAWQMFRKEAMTPVHTSQLRRAPGLGLEQKRDRIVFLATCEETHRANAVLHFFWVTGRC